MQKILMRMWIVSRGHKKSFLSACKSLYLLFFYFRDSVGCHFDKINEKKTEKIKIFTDDCTIYQI